MLHRSWTTALMGTTLVLLNLSLLIPDHRWQWVLEAGGVGVSRRLLMGAGLPCGVMEVFWN